MYDSSKLLPKSQFQQLVALLPTPKQRRMGRKRVAKEALVQGILQVLVNGVAWGKIAECGCSYASCYRYFQELQRRGKLKLIQLALARKKADLRKGPECRHELYESFFSASNATERDQGKYASA